MYLSGHFHFLYHIVTKITCCYFILFFKTRMNCNDITVISVICSKNYTCLGPKILLNLAIKRPIEVFVRDSTIEAGHCVRIRIGK